MWTPVVRIVCVTISETTAAELDLNLRYISPTYGERLERATHYHFLKSICTIRVILGCIKALPKICQVGKCFEQPVRHRGKAT